MKRTVAHRPGTVCPVPKRDGIFDRNVKNGVKYWDNKTKAHKFELDRISQCYNPNRLVHVSTADALIDPHITIRHEDALPKKDLGYRNIDQQDLFTRDRVRRVINDYTGTPIIKVDQEGGIFDQQLNQGNFRQCHTSLDKPELPRSARSLPKTVQGQRYATTNQWA